MPDNIESPTMRVVFLLHFWRFSFELGDIWGFFICVNSSCSLWRNSISWFSIAFIDVFSTSRYCCVFTFQSPSLCVWFSVKSLYVLFSFVNFFLFCVWKRSPAFALIWTGWAFVFLEKLLPALYLKKDIFLKEAIVSTYITSMSTWIIFSIKQWCIYQVHTWGYVWNIFKITVSRRF